MSESTEGNIKKGPKLTIGRKIGVGFGTLIFITLVTFLFIYTTQSTSKNISKAVVEDFTPSLQRLEDLDLLIVKSKMLIFNWVFMARPPDDPEKIKLRKLISNEYPLLKSELEQLTPRWNSKERAQIDSIFSDIDLLFSYQKEVMESLNSLISYEDPLVNFECRTRVEEGDIFNLTSDIRDKLDLMVKLQQEKTRDENDRMVQSLDWSILMMFITGLILTGGGVVVAYFTIRTIVGPVHKLKSMLLRMAKGGMPEERIPERQDEIGDMANALNQLISSWNSTIAFAKEVGSGNFKSDFKPLSDDDALGHALIRMRHDLAENERVLEQKVIERTEQVMLQKEEIDEKNKRLMVLYEALTDSIRYAKRIQSSILPPDSLIKKHFKDVFILYKPKDIVSGDFYWFDSQENGAYIAVVDCTGHGVPGALMSIVGYNVMNQAMILHKSGDKASHILDELNRGVSNTLRQGEDSKNSKDGMDVALCKLDSKNKILEYSGAFNSLYQVRNGGILETKADKFPIGYYAEDPERKYTNHEIEIQDGDVFYIYSDGYADQFGGPRGKKFMAKRFRELLVSISHEKMDKQKEILNTTIEDWRGDLEQLDDILVIGFKV